MRYFLYVNHPVNRAIVHGEGCPYIKMHGGEHHYDNGYWEEFAERSAAFRAMERTGKATRRACRHCAP